jgi:polar amino acid transport system substrate-binding protein
MFFVAACLSPVALAAETTNPLPDPPAFRFVPDQGRPDVPENLKVRLIADDSFPPFSFVSRTGAPTGLAVELAIAACERAQLDCTVEAKPFSEIVPALLRGEADVAVTGPQPDAAALQQLTATRPYFRIMGRFAAANASTFENAKPASLSGARIGVVKDTLHARWLDRYYGSADIVTFDSLAAAGEALKKAEVDAVFGDNLQVIYWLSGEAAAGCCRPLDGAFSDFDYFARDLMFLMPRNRPELRQAFDYGLDQAQDSGATARILRAYVPLW